MLFFFSIAVLKQFLQEYQSLETAPKKKPVNDAELKKDSENTVNQVLHKNFNVCLSNIHLVKCA